MENERYWGIWRLILLWCDAHNKGDMFSMVKDLVYQGAFDVRTYYGVLSAQGKSIFHGEEFGVPKSVGEYFD